MMDEESKKFRKKGKTTLIVVIVALALGLISIILGLAGINLGVVLIVIAISANLIAFIGLVVLLVNRIKYEKKKNPEKLSRDFEKVGYFILGIIVGINIRLIF